MKKKASFFVFFLAVVILFSFAGTAKKPEEVVIKIAETTDIHGAIFPYDFKDDAPTATSLAQVSSYVKQERTNSGQEFILIDNGDLLQGQPIVYYYNFDKPDSRHIVSETMNYMGYDLSVVGNHDIEAGHEVYDRLVKEFRFPWLAANAVKTSSGKPYFKPYTVIKKRGVKIAFLGMITPWIPNWLHEKLWEGMRFDDMVVSAEKWVEIIQKKESPDLIVGVFHSGVDYTYGGLSADTPFNENASKLAATKVDGFDIVFVGHDHQGHNFFTENGVLIVGGIDAAKTVAVARVSLRWDSEKKRWSKDISGQIVEVKDYEPDREFMENFKESFEDSKAYFAKPIGEFTETISSREAMFGDSAFVDLIHRIQLEISEADISFAAPLSFDRAIQKGNVHVRDMFKLYQYENWLYTMELTGKEIKDYLEYSYGNWLNRMKGSKDHLIRFKTDEKGELIWSNRYNSYETYTRYYNYDSAAGIIYEVDASKPEGEKIRILSMADGSAFDPNKTYRVAINSYRGSGGGGHLTKGVGLTKEEIAKRTTSSTIKDLRYYLMKWIEQHEVVSPERLENWKIVPEAWAQEAAQKDYTLLYGE